MATDWEATNEALEEEVARESYIQYFRDAEKRLKPQGAVAGSSSTITSAVCSSPRAVRRGSLSPKGSTSPKGGNSSPKGARFLAASVNLSVLITLTLLILATSRSSPRSSTHCDQLDDFASNYDKESDNKHFPDPNRPTTSEKTFDESRISGFAENAKNENAPSRRGSDLATSVISTSCILIYFTYLLLSLIGDEEWDDGIMAQILAESRNTYLDELKRNSKRRIGSPGPSTSR